MRLNFEKSADQQRWLIFLSISFLIVVPVLLFLPVFLFDKMIYGYDVVAVHLSYRAEIMRSLAAHEWPLWMPDILGGMPGIAACNMYFLYPSDLISTLAGWSMQTQFGLDAVLHVALAGIGMFLFLRRLDRSVSGALLGAFFFAVSGSEVSQLFGGYYAFVEGIALVPWAFWAAHKACKERSWFAWGLCGLAFALQIMSISIQLFAYTFVAVGAFVLAVERNQNTAAADATFKARITACLPVLQGLALALLLAFLLSAPQFWLSLQYLPLSTRQGYTHAEFITGSISLSEALTWLVPGSFGWQMPTYHGAMGACFTSEYFGLLPWALATGAVFALWRQEAWVRWMAGLALTAFFFSQGAWTPFYPIFHHLPVLSGFRIWSRILFLLTFSVCTMAAFGWDALRRIPFRAAALRGTAVFTVLALVAAAYAWKLAPERAAEDAAKVALILRLTTATHSLVEGLAALTRESARTTLALVPILLTMVWFGTKRLGTGAALVLALAFHGWDQNQVIKRFVTFVDPRNALGHPHFALPPPPVGREPWRIYDSDDAFPNGDVFLGYENLCGRESMPMLSRERMLDAMGTRTHEWVNLMNERYFFSHSKGNSMSPGDKVTIYENHDAFARAWLVGQSRKVAGDEQAYSLLADPGFNPRTEVALTVDSGLNIAPGRQESIPKGGVQWLDRSPQTCSLDVSTDRNAVLVLSNAWYPSWRCEVDGHETAVLKADGGLQAVILQAGRHQVDFRFDNGLFYDALAACLAGTVALVGLAWL